MFLKAVGLILIITGLIFTLYTGLGFRVNGEAPDIQSDQITVTSEYERYINPLIGIGVIVIGGIAFFYSSRNDIAQNRNEQ
ncbi:MAG: hypothetical protein V1720_06635 [bacterium]